MPIELRAPKLESLLKQLLPPVKQLSEDLAAVKAQLQAHATTLGSNTDALGKVLAAAGAIVSSVSEVSQAITDNATGQAALTEGLSTLSDEVAKAIQLLTQRTVDPARNVRMVQFSELDLEEDNMKVSAIGFTLAADPADPDVAKDGGKRKLSLQVESGARFAIGDPANVEVSDGTAKEWEVEGTKNSFGEAYVEKNKRVDKFSVLDVDDDSNEADEASSVGPFQVVDNMRPQKAAGVAVKMTDEVEFDVADAPPDNGGGGNDVPPADNPDEPPPG